MLNLGHVIESEGTDTPVKRFQIPLEGVTKAFAIVGIRESGKSSLGTVMAEEYCKLKQPWIAFDPAGNWWGLRARTVDKLGGFPVVVFGGERGDLPLEKDSGRKIAEAITRENVFAVIDLKMTSKTMWRTLVRDIVKTLQEIQVEVPRMVFIEEAQEFLPQRPSHQLGAECKEIVERLVTLGGNWGYGATILGQRPASIEKSALSQCETVFAFATQGAHDRKALIDWMKSQEVDEGARTALDRLASLETGTCYVWSPRFLKTFAKLRIRRRETFHPREARKLGVAIRDVEMAPVQEFVARLSKQLTKTVVTACPTPKNPKTRSALVQTAELTFARGTGQNDSLFFNTQLSEKAARIQALEDALAQQKQRVASADSRLAAVREFLKPQYESLKKLFSEIGTAADPGQQDLGAWQQWLDKAGAGRRGEMLKILIGKGRLPQVQLATLSGVKYGGSTWRNYRAWLTGNHLATIHGEEIEVAQL